MLERGDVEIRKHERGGGARLRGGFVELGIGDGKKGHDGDGTQSFVKLSGGEELLSGRMAEIEEKGMPLFGIEAAKGVGERRRARNLKRRRGRLHDGLGDLQPEGQFAQEKNLRTCDGHRIC